MKKKLEHQGDLPDIYCPKCGTKCLNRFVFDRYHQYNGKKVFEVFTRCPEYKSGFLWNNGHYSQRRESLYTVFGFYEDGTLVNWND